MEATAAKARRSTRKPRGDGHLRRAEILAAAERIFVAEGYEGATIRRIAEEVGVSSTALYMHFPDKSCILLEICEVAIQEVLARNCEIAARPLDAVTRTRLMLDSYMRFGLENPNAYRLAFIEGRPGSTQWHETTDELGARCFQIYSGVVREIAAEGRLRLGTPEVAAQTLWAACHGLVALLIARPRFAWEATEDMLPTMLDGLFHGLLVD